MLLMLRNISTQIQFLYFKINLCALIHHQIKKKKLQKSHLTNTKDMFQVLSLSLRKINFTLDCCLFSIARIGCCEFYNIKIIRIICERKFTLTCYIDYVPSNETMSNVSFKTILHHNARIRYGETITNWLECCCCYHKRPFLI